MKVQNMDCHRILNIYIILLTIVFKVKSVFTQNDNQEACKPLTARCKFENLPISHILPEICRNLNIQDLHNVRSVCSLFKEAADYALLKRSPEFKALQIKRSSRGQPGTEHISRSLTIRPHIALFFTVDTFPTDIYRSVSDEIFSRFLPELPPEVVALHVEGLSTLLDGQSVDIFKDQALGFFIPKPWIDVIEVRAFIIDYYIGRENPKGELNRFLWNMFAIPDNHMQNNHFGMIFMKSPFTLVENDEDTSDERIFANIKNRVKKMNGKPEFTLALWGSVADWLTIPNMAGLPIFYFATRISGPMVQCWSIAIDLTNSPAQIIRRITNFRNNVRINANSVGLLMISVEDTNPNNGMTNKVIHFRAAFQSLSMMTFGISESLSKYCYNSLDPQQDDPTIEYDARYACFMVVTYF